MSGSAEAMYETRQRHYRKLHVTTIGLGGGEILAVVGAFTENKLAILGGIALALGSIAKGVHDGYQYRDEIQGLDTQQTNNVIAFPPKE